MTEKASEYAWAVPASIQSGAEKISGLGVGLTTATGVGLALVVGVGIGLLSESVLFELRNGAATALKAIRTTKTFYQVFRAPNQLETLLRNVASIVAPILLKPVFEMNTSHLR